MARREAAKYRAQSVELELFEPSNRDADEVSDELLGRSRAVAVRKRRTAYAKTTALLRPKSHSASSHRSKYNTARGSRISCFELLDMEHQEVKAHIRDSTLLRQPEQWTDLINRRTTHLIIEDDDDKIKAVPQGVSKIESLKSLTLLWNKIENLPNHVLRIPLLELSVQKCPLRNINGIEQMKLLVKLELMHNGLTVLPPELGQLEGLETLNLTGNKIRALPMNIGNMRRLKMLCVCANRLTTLPLSLTGLRNLESLDASQNQLVELPDLIGNLSNLSTLRLTHNQLRTLPHSVKNLQELKHLFFSFNCFTAVPSVLGLLPELHTLHFASNSLQQFEDESGLRSLVVLILDKNNFTHFPTEIFKSTKLEQLSLQHNHIPTIPQEINQLNKLRALKLAHNDIDELPPQLCVLKDLRHLVLRKNSITELPSNFDCLESLKVIDLEETRIDYQFLYALKMNDIPGLFDEVRMRREQRKLQADNNSDHGSSVFDSEDETASESEEEKQKPAVQEIKPQGNGEHRDSGYTEGSQNAAASAQPRESNHVFPNQNQQETISQTRAMQENTSDYPQRQGEINPQRQSQQSPRTQKPAPPQPLPKPKPSTKPPPPAVKPSTKAKPSADTIARTLSQTSFSKTASESSLDRNMSDTSLDRKMSGTSLDRKMSGTSLDGISESSLDRKMSDSSVSSETSSRPKKPKPRPPPRKSTTSLSST